MSKIIAITGGIGSGKSVVSKILRCLGYCVYDCDSEAKRIMDTSEDIKLKLCELISKDSVQNGKINRPLISKIVFEDKSKLTTLNNIVHQFVLRDIIKKSKDYNYFFFETAILYQSGFDKICDEVWEVTAPIETRINRVIKRNGLPRKQVVDRINSQNYIPTQIHKNVINILNDDINPILPTILSLLKDLKYE